jgi:hypothetical protein
MEAFAEQVGDAERRNATAAGGVADFNEACGGILGNAKCEACGAAHEYVGGVAVDEDGRRTEAERTEMGADEFDFTEGQRGGRHDVVDARIGEGFSGGLGAGARHILTFDLKPDS